MSNKTLVLLCSLCRRAVSKLFFAQKRSIETFTYAKEEIQNSSLRERRVLKLYFMQIKNFGILFCIKNSFKKSVIRHYYQRHFHQRYHLRS